MEDKTCRFSLSPRPIYFIHIPKTGGQSIKKTCEIERGVRLHWRRHHVIAKHQRASDVIREWAASTNDFKFSFIRNPWDRFVSAYFYLSLSPDPDYAEYRSFDSFEDFVKNGSLDELHFKPLVYWIDTEVDFIGRFENLQNDFNSLCDKFKIPYQALAHENKSNHKPYWEYYNNETETLIGEKYAEDIERFGYEFR